MAEPLEIEPMLQQGNAGITAEAIATSAAPVRHLLGVSDGVPHNRFAVRQEKIGATWDVVEWGEFTYQEDELVHRVRTIDDDELPGEEPINCTLHKRINSKGKVEVYGVVTPEWLIWQAKDAQHRAHRECIAAITTSEIEPKALLDVLRGQAEFAVSVSAPSVFDPHARKSVQLTQEFFLGKLPWLGKMLESTPTA